MDPSLQMPMVEKLRICHQAYTNRQSGARPASTPPFNLLPVNLQRVEYALGTLLIVHVGYSVSPKRRFCLNPPRT